MSGAGDDASAMAGVSALLLFVASQNQPRQIGDRMRALLSHLPTKSLCGKTLPYPAQSDPVTASDFSRCGIYGSNTPVVGGALGTLLENILDPFCDKQAVFLNKECIPECFLTPHTLSLSLAKSLSTSIPLFLAPEPTSTSAGPPLLVLAESEDLVEPLQTWLAEEASSGTGRRVGPTRVAVLPPADRNAARERTVLQSVHWLAEGSAPQPNLRVRFVAIVSSHLKTICKIIWSQ